MSVWVGVSGCMCAYYKGIFVIIIFVASVSGGDFWKNSFLLEVPIFGRICPSLDAQALFIASGGHCSQVLLFASAGNPA